MTRAQLRDAARRILRAGLAAVEPARLVRRHLRIEGRVIRVGQKTLTPKRVFVVSVGKAAVPMALAAQRVFKARLTDAIVVAPFKAPLMPRTKSFVAGHPIPDAAGVRAAREVIRLLSHARRGDLVLLLLSGGASALMPAPIDGVSLRAKQRVTRLMLLRGATIAELNAVRKSLSRLKGGGFARLAAPARVVALALSDVPGDDVGTIGSGPAVDDPNAGANARRAFRKFLSPAEVPAKVRAAFDSRDFRKKIRTRATTVVIGSGRTFAQAAQREARELGFRTRVLPNAVHGEARACGAHLVARFAALRGRGSSPFCLVATGETVVKVQGKGTGGRNQEVALSAIGRLAELHRPTVLAAFATDGSDGTSGASGGLVDDRTESRAIARKVSIQQALDQNDSSTALQALDGLIVTGPTGTNVADITLLLG